ncbi:hypothetical protein CFOL_v3_07497 [Cephalotus follicularis]|uniref:Uncharacterized protein n=1 Tax=Cephalotus follicularis TaxID=3775 RepID=A0A1Q3B7S2_CEPFO|nr:hypothetical protein CFOL_v3_07497 [Cephalotus follicularis]
MNSLILHSTFPLPSPSHLSSPRLQLKPGFYCTHQHRPLGYGFRPLSFSFPFSSRASNSSIGDTNEGTISVINFKDFVEKDWSFLDSAELYSNEEHNIKINRIISAGEIESTSKVLVSIGSEGFVDQLACSSPCNLLLVVHDSLFLLACIKEKYDKVKCWQGELIYVPEKWAPLDVVFIYFLPGLPFKLDQVFGMLAQRCSPGARLVISHPQGRKVLEQQRKQFPDVVVSDLPDETALQKVAADHCFEMAEFFDEPGLYLAVLKLCKATNQ